MGINPWERKGHGQAKEKCFVSLLEWLEDILANIPNILMTELLL